MRPPQVRAYLTQTALNKAMDEGKRAGRRRSVSLDDDDLRLEPVDPGRELDERLAASFDDARIREIVSELPERQQIVVKLRFFFGRTPQEIQRYLGVTERVYRRELERATRHIAHRYQLVRQGTYCLRARQHLRSCPACANWVAVLRTTAARAAAAVPSPALVVAGDSTPAEWIGSLREARVDHAGTGEREGLAPVVSISDRSRPGRLGGVHPKTPPPSPAA
jgi:hypothetical protein